MDFTLRPRLDLGWQRSAFKIWLPRHLGLESQTLALVAISVQIWLSKCEFLNVVRQFFIVNIRILQFPTFKCAVVESGF